MSHEILERVMVILIAKLVGPVISYAGLLLIKLFWRLTPAKSRYVIDWYIDDYQREDVTLIQKAYFAIQSARVWYELSIVPLLDTEARRRRRVYYLIKARGNVNQDNKATLLMWTHLTIASKRLGLNKLLVNPKFLREMLGKLYK